jgi:membrane associated rhomboid family serine protease
MFLRYNQFTILLFIVIFVLCGLPEIEVPESGLEYLDKGVHAVLFALFSFCMIVGFTKQHQYSFLSHNVYSITIIFAIVYGALIELFQGFVLVDRAFEWLDIAADIFGVFVGVFSFWIIMNNGTRRVKLDRT